MLVDTLLFADNQIIVTSFEDGLKQAVFQFSKTTAEFSLDTYFTSYDKGYSLPGKEPLPATIVLQDHIVEEVMSFIYAQLFGGL